MSVVNANAQQDRHSTIISNAKQQHQYSKYVLEDKSLPVVDANAQED